MERNTKGSLWAGLGLLLAFALWTVLVCRVDVRQVGPMGSSVGFAALNTAFHRLSGVHMALYTLTDWLGLVPVGVCAFFGVLGLVQLFRRKRLRLVDPDLLLLGIYYLLVIAAYLLFEAVPINYRPILIEGRLEASYPSSTTLLVLSVMPTLKLQLDRRSKRAAVRTLAGAFAVLFSAFVVVGRLISGVHWVTDIVGAVLLGLGLFFIYRYGVACSDRRGGKQDGIQ